MPADVFHFRQFSIRQDQCAMKISTDGILLGAWAPLAHAKHILDVGTGTGLLALMAAQRALQARIVGLELDLNAAQQAAQNAAASPWADRIRIEGADFLSWEAPMEFDHIICNPPYFFEGIPSADKSRALARHISPEHLADWLTQFARVSHPNAKLSMVFPRESIKRLQSLALDAGWHLAELIHLHLTILIKS
ncbi:MAG: methyltransferase [Bacteroidota bacterium]